MFAAIGLVSMLSLVSVISAMDGASGMEAVVLQVRGDGLAHTYEWAFEWGPGLVAGIDNGILLGYLMLRLPWVSCHPAQLPRANGLRARDAIPK